MDDDKSFGAICLAYLSGTIAGAFIIGLIMNILPSTWLITSIHIVICLLATSAIIGLSLIIYILKSQRLIKLNYICLIFIIIGMLSYSEESTAVYRGNNILNKPQQSAQILKEHIDSLPFRHEATKGLLKALFTGDRKDIDKDIKEAFRKSGASHILALSGMHLGLIYLILNKVLSILGHFPIAVLIKSMTVLTTTGYYVLMTGASDSIVRAYLFILINEFCRLSGRKTFQLRTLLTAITIQLTFHPIAILSPGFQLSYCAMCGIYILFPKIQDWFPNSEDGRTNPVKKIWSLASLSISCQAFTAPIAWWHFKSFPQYFLITNLIAMPLTSLLMIVAIILIGISSIVTPPTFAITLVESLASTLIFCLKTISSL